MNVQKTIKDLETQRDLIQTAIASLKAIQNGKEPKSEKTIPTIASAAVAHLRKVGEKQTSAQMRKALREAGVTATDQSIQTVLSKQARKRKDLVHKGHDTWALRI